MDIEEGVGVDADLELMEGAALTVPLHAHMGLNVKQMTPYAILEMPVSEAVRGSTSGTVHGGMLATLADVACAFSLWGSYEFPGEIPVTTDMHVRYYRQPRSSPVTAEARIVHRGRRLLSAECSITDADGRELVRATATYMIVQAGVT